MDPRVKPEDDDCDELAGQRPPLPCRAFVAWKAKQLASRPLRGPLLNPHKGEISCTDLLRNGAQELRKSKHFAAETGPIIPP